MDGLFPFAGMLFALLYLVFLVGAVAAVVIGIKALMRIASAQERTAERIEELVHLLGSRPR